VPLCSLARTLFNNVLSGEPTVPTQMLLVKRRPTLTVKQFSKLNVLTCPYKN